MRLFVRAWPALIVLMALIGAQPRTVGTSEAARVRPEHVGLSADALKLPERVFHTQVSRGWQFLSLPLAATGEHGVLAASDGLYWSFELRALVKKASEATVRVGLVFRYEDEGSYAALLWDTRTGALTLRGLRRNQATEAARGQAAFGEKEWASVIVRDVMGEVVCYINGEKVLAAVDSGLLGRVAVYAVGGSEVRLAGVEARRLDPRDADADVFTRSRSEFETKCAACHELDGPWNTHFAPDDWESVVNGMLVTDGADRIFSRTEANRIIDYLRIISLHPDRSRYRPAEER